MKPTLSLHSTICFECLLRRRKTDQLVIFCHAKSTPYGQKIRPSQFPDQNHPVNRHCCQPRDQQPNPARAAAAPGPEPHGARTVPAGVWDFLTNRDSPYQRTVPGGTWGLGPRVQLTISDMCRAVARKLGRLKASNPIA